MKFLESTSFFVRTIMFDFINSNADIKLKFCLAPMIHIGTEEYYQAVIENLKKCDEILYEGISLFNKKESLYKRLSLKGLISSFRRQKTAANKLGLVTQRESFDLSALKDKLTHADYSVATGAIAWKALSLKEKLKLSIVEPLQTFAFYQDLSRASLAKHFMTANEEAYLAYGPLEDEEGTAQNFVMNGREQIVFSKIKERLIHEAELEKTIGIVYGAGHMKSIARYLIDHYNYVPRNGKFIKVFDVI